MRGRGRRRGEVKDWNRKGKEGRGNEGGSVDGKREEMEGKGRRGQQGSREIINEEVDNT